MGPRIGVYTCVRRCSSSRVELNILSDLFCVIYFMVAICWNFCLWFSCITIGFNVIFWLLYQLRLPVSMLTLFSVCLFNYSPTGNSRVMWKVFICLLHRRFGQEKCNELWIFSFVEVFSDGLFARIWICSCCMSITLPTLSSGSVLCIASTEPQLTTVVSAGTETQLNQHKMFKRLYLEQCD